MKLTNQQQEAVDLIKKWYSTYKETKKQIFVLSGYAGTGKTTIINYIIENELNLNKNHVAYATPTGKAAAVLIQKGSPATTVHRLMYTPVVEDLNTELNGKTVQSKKITFVKRKSIGHYKLIILDEVSMINKKIMEDLISYGVPILATGDIGQLPACGAESNDLLKHPDYNLTEIVRQAEDNQILKIATMARLNQEIPFGDFTDVIVYDRHMLSNEKFSEILLNTDQIICGKNSTRIKLNKLVRELKNLSGLPNDNEKLICELNNYEIEFNEEYSLVNGMSGYVKNFKILDEKLKLATISFKPDFLDEYYDDILIEYNIFENDEYLYEKHQNIYFMNDGTYRLATPLFKRDEKENKEAYLKKLREEFKIKKHALGTFVLNQFQYGYAISCHKSQGSQWDNVVIIDEHNVFGDEGNRWLYTAITRSSKKLIIIK